MRKTITIISDWQNEDFYLASLKARLQQLINGYELMSISHNIKPFDSMQAAFVLRASWRNFPKGSIHMNCVNTMASAKSPHVLLCHKGHFFIGSDLGYWTFICGETPEKCYLLNNEQVYEGCSFPEYHVFAGVAAAIAQNISPEELGGQIYESKTLTELFPIFEKNRITASVVYFDSFGNAITNLSKSDFDRFTENQKIIISILSERNQMRKISHSYVDVKSGEFIALFNSQNLLEVAVREGDMHQLLNLEIGSPVRIDIVP